MRVSYGYPKGLLAISPTSSSFQHDTENSGDHKKKKKKKHRDEDAGE